MKKISFFVLTITVLALAACQTAAPASIIKVTSAGTQVAAFSSDEVKKLTAVEADYTGKDGAVTHYKGFTLTALLAKPGVTDASVITFVAADGYTAELSGKDLLACTGCMVVFMEKGGLQLVMPGFSGKLQVKDLIEIQVK